MDKLKTPIPQTPIPLKKKKNYPLDNTNKCILKLLARVFQ